MEGHRYSAVLVKFKGLIGRAPAYPNDNLHAVWDSTLIRQTTYAWGSYVDRLEGDWLLKHPEASVTLDPIAWTLEAHKAAQQMANGITDGTALDDDYYTRRPTQSLTSSWGAPGYGWRRC
jgi:hypothetical protein